MNPFNVFEPAWVLFNLALTDCLNDELLALCKPHLDFLESAWSPGKGVGFAADYIPKDSDETSLAYDVLTQFNRKIDLEAILHYEQPYYFRCYDLESTPSVSANIHVLGALRRASFHKDSPQVKKITQFLGSVQEKSNCWFDKWHISPYYATAQAVIASAGYVDELVEDAIMWFLKTQNEDGSWGYYFPTAEETAYSLQALSIWSQNNRIVPKDTLKRGQSWLIQNSKPPYPPLWIAKSLYCPELIVYSQILSALLLVKKELI
jgi:halimadienyl-diphosphate synthase